MEIIKNTVTTIEEGTTGQVVANMLNPVLASIYGIEQYEIKQADVSDYKVVYNHNKDTLKVLPFLYDTNWKQINAEIFSLNDGSNPSSNHWMLNIDNEITGTLHLFVIYLV